MHRVLPVLFALLLPFVALAALHCAVCNREIRGEYLRVDGKDFCSEACWKKTLPRCAVCNMPLAGEYVKFDTGLENRLLCRKCSENPRCFACGFPDRCRRLPDGRMICPTCEKTAVTDPAEAEKLYRGVEALVGRLLGSPGCGRTQFQLCDRTALDDDSSELGSCRYEYTTLTVPGRKPELAGEHCTISILDHLPRAQFVEVAAHEAAHDWQNHHAFGVKDPVWREGFAEYIASLVNTRCGNSRRNLRMERNPDPVYGGGFRAVRDFALRNQLSALPAELRRH